MGASSSDYSHSETTAKTYWATKWAPFARALGGIAAWFNAKQVSGNEPSDKLTGIFLSDETLTKAVRVQIDTSKNVTFAKNTATDETPSWTTIFTVSSTGQITAEGSLAMNTHSIAGVSGFTMVGGSANFGSGGITNAGSIAGATTYSGSGDINLNGTGVIKNMAEIASGEEISMYTTSAPTNSKHLVPIAYLWGVHAGLGNPSPWNYQVGFTLSDDEALSHTFNAYTAASATEPGQGLLFIANEAATADANRWALISFNETAVVKLTGGSDYEVTTGALTGTTGTDTKLTVSIESETPDKLWVENRLGVSANVYAVLFIKPNALIT